jgi:hypothetical protein
MAEIAADENFFVTGNTDLLVGKSLQVQKNHEKSGERKKPLVIHGTKLQHSPATGKTFLRHGRTRRTRLENKNCQSDK